MENLTVGLIQMHCEKGVIAQNLESTSRYFAEAVARGIDIIGCPEMSITGYVDPTRCPEAILYLDGPEVTQAIELRAQTAAQIVAELAEVYAFSASS